MSLVFAEGLDRVQRGTIANNSGILRASEWITCVTTKPTQLVTVGSYGGRNYLYAPGDDRVQHPNGSDCYLSMFLSRVPNQAMAKKFIIGWKVTWPTGADLKAWNNHYLAMIGNALLSAPALNPTDKNTYVDKGYFYFECVYDRRTSLASIYVDGVFIKSVANTGTEELRINFRSLYAMVSGSVSMTRAYYTDLYVIVDDGVGQCNRLGEVSIRDVNLTRETPSHPDLEVGRDLANSVNLGFSSPQMRLVGDGTNVVYKPSDSTPNVSTYTTCAVVVDYDTVPGTPINGKVETRIVTPTGTTSKTQTVSATELGRKSVIHDPMGRLTYNELRNAVSFELVARTP